MPVSYESLPTILSRVRSVTYHFLCRAGDLLRQTNKIRLIINERRVFSD